MCVLWCGTSLHNPLKKAAKEESSAKNRPTRQVGNDSRGGGYMQRTVFLGCKSDDEWCEYAVFGYGADVEWVQSFVPVGI